MLKRVFLRSTFKSASLYLYDRASLAGNNVLFSVVRCESFFVGRLPDDWASSRESIRRKALRFSVLRGLDKNRMSAFNSCHPW